MESGDIESARKSLHQSLEILQQLKSEYEAARTVLLLTQLSLESELKFDLDSFREAKRTFESIGAKADLEQASTLSGKLKI
jgi:DNA-binding SARP family transcriptional activator